MLNSFQMRLFHRRGKRFHNEKRTLYCRFHPLLGKGIVFLVEAFFSKQRFLKKALSQQFFLFVCISTVVSGRRVLLGGCTEDVLVFGYAG